MPAHGGGQSCLTVTNDVSVRPHRSRLIRGCFGRSDRSAQRSGPRNTLAAAADDGSPLRPSARTIGGRSSSMVPSSSPEPFSGTGGHHGCGAGPSALARARMPSRGRDAARHARPHHSSPVLPAERSGGPGVGKAGGAGTMDSITRVLNAIEHGDLHAAERLLPLVYEELRKLAAQRWPMRSRARRSRRRSCSTKLTS